MPVHFIDEERKRKTPDLRIDSIGYVESKDLHTANRDNIGATIAGKVIEANLQLRAMQARDPLPGSGICIDLPWGTLPLKEPEGKLIADLLSQEETAHFLLLSASGSDVRTDAVRFPVSLSLIWKPEAVDLYEPALRKLTKKSHLLRSGRFEIIEHQFCSVERLRRLLAEPLA